MLDNLTTWLKWEALAVGKRQSIASCWVHKHWWAISRSTSNIIYTAKSANQCNQHSAACLLYLVVVARSRGARTSIRLNKSGLRFYFANIIVSTAEQPSLRYYAMMLSSRQNTEQKKQEKNKNIRSSKRGKITLRITEGKVERQKEREKNFIYGYELYVCIFSVSLGQVVWHVVSGRR